MKRIISYLSLFCLVILGCTGKAFAAETVKVIIPVKIHLPENYEKGAVFTKLNAIGNDCPLPEGDTDASEAGVELDFTAPGDYEYILSLSSGDGYETGTQEYSVLVRISADMHSQVAVYNETGEKTEPEFLITRTGEDNTKGQVILEAQPTEVRVLPDEQGKEESKTALAPIREARGQTDTAVNVVESPSGATYQSAYSAEVKNTVKSTPDTGDADLTAVYILFAVCGASGMVISFICLSKRRMSK